MLKEITCTEGRIPGIGGGRTHRCFVDKEHTARCVMAIRARKAREHEITRYTEPLGNDPVIV